MIILCLGLIFRFVPLRSNGPQRRKRNPDTDTVSARGKRRKMASVAADMASPLAVYVWYLFIVLISPLTMLHAANLSSERLEIF